MASGYDGFCGSYVCCRTTESAYVSKSEWMALKIMIAGQLLATPFVIEPSLLREPDGALLSTVSGRGMNTVQKQIRGSTAMVSWTYDTSISF